MGMTHTPCDLAVGTSLPGGDHSPTASRCVFGTASDDPSVASIAAMGKWLSVWANFLATQLPPTYQNRLVLVGDPTRSRLFAGFSKQSSHD